MEHLIAAVFLLIFGAMCFWALAHTPRGTPVFIDGPLFLIGLFCMIGALVAFVRLALFS